MSLLVIINVHLHFGQLAAIDQDMLTYVASGVQMHPVSVAIICRACTRHCGEIACEAVIATPQLASDLNFVIYEKSHHSSSN
jgi:hypothetical protein